MASWWSGSARSLILCSAGVLALCSTLPFVGIGMELADPCDTSDGTDCWGAGMAVLAFAVAAPFALYAIAVSAAAALRSSRPPALSQADQGVLVWGMLLLGVPLVLAAVTLSVEGAFDNEVVRALLAPLMLLTMFGLYATPVGWVLSVIGVSGAAFRRRAPPAAPAAAAT